jgi:hypothetical protein
MFMEPRNRFQGMSSASLCSLAYRYDNPIPTRFLAPIDCLEIPAPVDPQNKYRRIWSRSWLIQHLVKGTVSQDSYFLRCCADGFHGLSKDFHYPVQILAFYLLL